MAIRDTLRRSDHLTRLGLIAGAATFCVVIVQTLFFPSIKDVTPAYRGGAEGFLQGIGLYPDPNVTINGFLYLPGFAVLYIPFDVLGARLGDALWKVAGAALLTYAAWSNCRDMNPEFRLRTLSLAILISIPVVAGSFLQGQANIHVAAACWLMTLAAFRGHAAATVFWAGIAILAKPVAIVAILLVGGVRPKAIPALLGGIVWALALPFAAADARYVIALYGEVWTMLTTMALASRFVAADFTAVLASLGWTLDPVVIAVIRVVAALASFAMALWLTRRLPQNAAALAVFILSAAYMCLFSPRAEGLTYAMLGLPCALVIAAGLYEGRARFLWGSAAALLIAVGSNGVSPWLLDMTRFWFKPALFAALLILMAVAVARARAGRSNIEKLFDVPAPGAAAHSSSPNLLSTS